ncbi:MAG: flagellar basal body L-ring protein FlgH [Curvibacter sp.]|jgi:flagellar L-ring protein precursor FlgH|nr:flagellar basal body L-ring protein FlgH [Curvibacter sp.]
MKHLVLILGVCVLAGCASVPEPARVDFADTRMAPLTAQPAARTPTGSLFQPATYRASFEDRRARQVGDNVTIRIVENVTASQKSSSTANRTSTIDGGITMVPGFKFPGTAADNRLRIGANSEADFSGKGGTEAANTFSGSITATVTEVLPNGHLLIAGEKQIGLNHNVDVMRFTGTVDPLAIQPGSIVNSSSVANVRVESKGRGPQHEAQTVGWLTRFFMSVWPL